MSRIPHDPDLCGLEDGPNSPCPGCRAQWHAALADDEVVDEAGGNGKPRSVAKPSDDSDERQDKRSPSQGGSDGERPVIPISTEEDVVNDAAVTALAADTTIYQRGGSLVRILRDESPATKGIRRPMAPRIEVLPAPLLRERLAACAQWITLRDTNDGVKERAEHPPGWCVSAVHARGSWPGIRHLEAVLDYPVLRLDGTILSMPGYDPDSGLLLHIGELHLHVPDTPSLDDAIRARDKLLEVVEDFPFEKPVYRAAWLVALLTPLARFAFAGPAPLFLADANVRASGKGLLHNAIAKIITGQRFTIATYTDDENELRKRITALAMGGDRLVLFDNVVGNLGNGVLDAALTGDSWSDRVLGLNRMYHGPLYCTWYATGNNVAISGDTPRRCCPIRLESSLERPEDREDFRHPHLLDWIGEKRGELLSAALTIMRAYCAAGKPAQNLPAWGSFEGWSALVRSAVVWIGLPDPREACLLLQNQSDVAAQHMHVLLDCWEKIDSHRKGLTAAEVIATIYPKQAIESAPAYHADLRDVLDAMLAKPDARSLGNTLGHYRRRIFGERYIDHAGKRQGAVRWAVFPAVRFKPGTEETHQTHQTHDESGSQGESGESGESVSSHAAGNSGAQDDFPNDFSNDEQAGWSGGDYGPYREKY